MALAPRRLAVFQIVQVCGVRPESTLVSIVASMLAPEKTVAARCPVWRALSRMRPARGAAQRRNKFTGNACSQGLAWHTIGCQVLLIFELVFTRLSILLCRCGNFWRTDTREAQSGSRFGLKSKSLQSSSILKRRLCRINLTTHESACGVRDLAGREELASGSVRRSSLFA